MQMQASMKTISSIKSWSNTYIYVFYGEVWFVMGYDILQQIDISRENFGVTSAATIGKMSCLKNLE